MAVYELADLDAKTAGAIARVVQPLLAIAQLLMIVRIVLSWYPQVNSKKLPWSAAVLPTEWILGPTRRLIPPVGGVDISPIIWFAFLSFTNEILVGPQLFAEKETYHDNWWDRMMIRFFSTSMSQELGGLPHSDDYDGFVTLSKEIMRGRNTPGQHLTVAGVLKPLLPPEATQSFRKLFSKEGALGIKGAPAKWKSKVKIRKCRYLEATACAGICTNLCKVPTQDFFANTFNLPLTMNPNFEDLSCEMLFGVEPPPIEQDAVYGQPCYSVCKIAQEGRAKACHRVDTERGRKGISDVAAPAAAISPAGRWSNK